MMMALTVEFLLCVRHIPHTSSFNHHHKPMWKVLFNFPDTEVREGRPLARGHKAIKWVKTQC